ncbi:membrane protein [Gammaproteobacteria bacterium]|nr:membrane protein [Gammaproteobacteria bacterium]
MIIDWLNFTPIAGLLGGGLIGIAAAILILFNGRIAGISGIIAGLLRPKPTEILWRLAFVFGILAAPYIYSLFAHMPKSRIDASITLLIIAGLLVGLGTRYGSGCTSGHGVCGISRLSIRSIVATIVFMGAGFISVYIMRHIYSLNILGF